MPDDVVDVDRPRQRRREPGAEAHQAGDRAGDERRIELRQAGLRDLAADAREQVVERRARAVREAGVAVAGDGAEEDGQPRREARVAAGDERLGRRRVDMREIEPPGEQLRERRAGVRRHRQRAVLAEHRHADGAGVESLRVRADDVLVDAAVTALVDGAEAIDEEVVADVVPAVALHVVELDRPHERRCLRGRVPVRAGRVVDEREPQRARVGGSCATNLLVRVPALPWHDRGRTGALQPSARGRRCPGSRRTRPAAGGRCRAGGTRSGPRGRPTRGCRAASRRLVPARPCRRRAGPLTPAPRPATGSNARDAERVRNCTEPGPRQCRPTRLKREGAEAAASVRSPASGTSRETIVASCARAGAGRARARPMSVRRRLGTRESPRGSVAASPFGDKRRAPRLTESLQLVFETWRPSHGDS